MANLTSGTLILTSAGAFTLGKSGTQQTGTGPVNTVSELINGTWRLDGNTITLSAFTRPTLITATYASGAITHTENGWVYVWRK